MKRYCKIFNKLIITVLFCTVILASKSFAAKYTIARGIDFNTRVKLHIDKSLSSSTPDYTIIGFEQSTKYGEDMIDISEDGDSSVLAYIKDNVLYYVADDDVYLNKDASFMFDKFVNMRYVDLSAMNFKKTTDTSFMFSNCKMLTNLNMDSDDIFKLSSMTGMFYNCESMVNLHIFMLNTRGVNDMSNLFYNCRNLKNIYIDPSIFRTSQVNNFTDTFANCESLKTNFLRKAIDIKASEYKKYAIAGNDDENKEGLFRDFDYDYTFNDTKSDNLKVDISAELTEADANTNKYGTYNKNLVNDARVKSNLNIATDSELYEYYSNAKIKNGRLTLSDSLLSQTLEELPDEFFETVDNAAILLSETTFVDKLVPKRSGSWSEIVPSSDEVQGSEISNEEKPTDTGKGILRPNFTDATYDEESSESVVAETTEKNGTYSQAELNIVLIILAFIFIVAVGTFTYYFRNKKDDGDTWS